MGGKAVGSCSHVKTDWAGDSGHLAVVNVMTQQEQGQLRGTEYGEDRTG